MDKIDFTLEPNASKTLCFTCKHCPAGQRVDDTVDLFNCDQYDLWVYGAKQCSKYKKKEEK